MYHPTGYKTSERTTAGLEASLESMVQREIVRMFVAVEDYEAAHYHQALAEVYQFTAHAWLYPYHNLPASKKAHGAPDDAN